VKFLALSVLMVSFTAVASKPEPWTYVSDPNIAGPNLERNFDKLPLAARNNDEKKFWSGDYWAHRDGSINYRWNASRQVGWRYSSPSREQALQMSQEQLAELSPTEKLDLFSGNYDYPTKALVYEVAYPDADEWEGICHGWAPASMNHHEPTPKTVTNPDGIVIPFGAADIKALISYYYAWGFEVSNTHQMGLRCDKKSRDGGCKEDLNAGAFHIILGNKIGLEGTGFIADLDKSKEVWNHPVFAYSSEIEKTEKPKRNSARGTAVVYRMKTRIKYVDESLNFWETVLGTEKQKVKEKKYEYSLDVDSFGEIIGGEWDGGGFFGGGSDRPDFLWTKSKPTEFTGSFARLPELLND
jgi:hypothetical protein